MSASWTALPCEWYILSETDIISMLPISDNAWTEQPFMQLVSTFVYFKDVSAPLESICYFIKEKEIKQARQKKKEERKKKQLGKIQIQYANDLYSK